MGKIAIEDQQHAIANAVMAVRFAWDALRREQPDSPNPNVERLERAITALENECRPIPAGPVIVLDK